MTPAAPLVEAETENPAEFRPSKGTRKTKANQGGDFQAKIQAIVDSADAADAELIRPLLADWVKIDPAAAGRYAKSLPAGKWRDTIVRQIARGWAGQDPTDAEKWASRLPDQTERDSAVSTICFQVAQTDARNAVEIAERQGLDVAPGAVLENLVGLWASQDIPSASAWIQAFPAGNERDAMWGRLAYVQSASQPAAAADLVLDRIPAGPTQNEATISVLHQWAARDLTAATAWVGQFPPGALRDRAEQELHGLAAIH